MWMQWKFETEWMNFGADSKDTDANSKKMQRRIQTNIGDAKIQIFENR